MTARTSRRVVLAGAPAALAGLGAGAADAAIANPDAELLRACRDYMAAWDACEAHGGHADPDVCPYYQAVEQAERRAMRAPARTLAGVRAKAEVASFLAHRNGGHGWGESFTGDWPAAVCQDLLRLVPGGAA